MKTTILILTLSILLVSCQNDKKNTNNCTQHFDSLFMNLFDNDKTFQVKETKEVIPKFPPTFYNKKELSKFIFFELKNDSSVFTIAVDTFNIEYGHTFHFCNTYFNYQFIDFSSYAIGNLNFINECSSHIPTTASNQSGWTHNLYNKNLNGSWIIDSVYGESLLTSIHFTRRECVLNDIDTIQYYKEGFELFNSEDSTVVFESIALSENSLVLYDIINNDTLFLTK